MKMMSEKVLLLMEQLQRLHFQYKKGDFKSFWIQYKFEIYYWSQFQRLSNLIQQKIFSDKPFQNK